MLQRWLKHLTTTHFALRRCFPAPTLASIDAAITDSERLHRAEIRFAVETALPAGHLVRGVSGRERAAEVFANLHVWDTAENNGILLYVLLAEQDIEIIADRAFSGRVDVAAWEAICVAMETAYRSGNYRSGSLDAIARITSLAAAHFPGRADDRNELPNRPTIL